MANLKKAVIVLRSSSKYFFRVQAETRPLMSWHCYRRFGPSISLYIPQQVRFVGVLQLSARRQRMLSVICFIPNHKSIKKDINSLRWPTLISYFVEIFLDRIIIFVVEMNQKTCDYASFSKENYKSVINIA